MTGGELAMGQNKELPFRHLTWILSSLIWSSRARSSRIWMPGNFSSANISSSRSSCSFVNAVLRRLCLDLSSWKRKRSFSGLYLRMLDALKAGTLFTLTKVMSVWMKFLVLGGYLGSAFPINLNKPFFKQTMTNDCWKLTNILTWRVENFRALHAVRFDPFYVHTDISILLKNLVLADRLCL